MICQFVSNPRDYIEILQVGQLHRTSFLPPLSSRRSWGPSRSGPASSSRCRRSTWPRLKIRVEHNTGCPKDGRNSNVPLFSAIHWAISIKLGVLNLWMVRFFSCIKYKDWWPYVSYTNGESWDMLENAVFNALLSSNGATSDLSDFSVSFVWFVLFYPCPCFLTDLDRQCSHYWPFWHYRGMQNKCNNEKLAA